MTTTTAVNIAKKLKQKLEIEVPKTNSVTEKIILYWLSITVLFSVPVLSVTIIFVFLTAIIIGITMLVSIVPILGMIAFVQRKRGKK